jgi:hypothetical protein
MIADRLGSETQITSIPLDHDYGDDATLLANFLTVPHPTLRQQAAITLLCMAVREAPRVVVDEDAVDVCAAAIFDVTRFDGTRMVNVSPAACATLAHLACRAFARHQTAEPTGAVDQHALLAIGEACAEVMGPPL